MCLSCLPGRASSAHTSGSREWLLVPTPPKAFALLHPALPFHSPSGRYHAFVNPPGPTCEPGILNIPMATFRQQALCCVACCVLAHIAGGLPGLPNNSGLAGPRPTGLPSPKRSHHPPTAAAMAPPEQQRSGAPRTIEVPGHQNKRDKASKGRGPPRPLCLSASDVIAQRTAFLSVVDGDGNAVEAAASEGSGLRRKGVMEPRRRSVSRAAGGLLERLQRL